MAEAMRTRAHRKLTRWLLAGLRALVALVLLIALPSRPAMAGCFDDLLAVDGASASGDANEVESDGCCPSKDAARTDAEPGASSFETERPSHSDSGCPCRERCPSGCRAACGFAAVVLSPSFALAPVRLTPDLEVDRVAEPPSGVGLEISHVPR